MPSLHFTSPYGHVKPQLLQALSIKRKKTRAAATAAAAVFKIFTNTRGRDVILRQGVKYRNMFHAGSGLVRERQPGEEVTPEKAWVTDEESEQSETEGSEEGATSVMVNAKDVVEGFEAEQENMEEAEVLVVAVEEEPSMHLIHEPEEVANTDLLKLEISLAEKDIPQVPAPQAPMVQPKDEVVEAEVLPAQELTSERPIREVLEQGDPVVVPSKEIKQQELVVGVVEQAPESVEQVTEQEPLTEVIEEKITDAVLVPEPQLELALEPTHSEPLSIASVMNLLEPAEREQVTFTAVMNVLQSSKPDPSMVVMEVEVIETSIPEPFVPIEIADVQQPESILEVKEVEVSPLDDIPEEVEEEQENMKTDDIEQQTEVEIQETLVEEEEGKTLSEEPHPEDEVVEIQETLVEEEEVKTLSEESHPEDEVVDIQETLVEVEEAKALSEESRLEDEVVDTPPNQPIQMEPEVQETAPTTQPHLPSSIAEPTLEVQSEELAEEVVEKVLPIHVQVISPQPPQETPVLAISEKHSEQLFDDEYDETELNEDEEPEVEAEVELENLKLEGSLEFTPSHLFKLTLPVPSSVNSPSPSTVAICVKPGQTLADLQKLIQLELPYTSTSSQHISFTTLGTEPPDCTTDIASKTDSTGFAIKDGESTTLRKPLHSNPSKRSSKSICIPTRWSLSTEIGAFIGDAARRQCFTIGLSHTPDKPPSTTICIVFPSFNDRTLHQRSQLRILTPNLSSLCALKSECDAAVQRTTRKRSILTLAMSGFACLLLPLLLITFAYLSQPGLLPPGELKPSHPITTYLVAGLADILILAGFAYLWSVYRTTGRHSLPDLATVKKVYSERGFDAAKWEELQTENTRLRCEIRRVAAEYGVTLDDDELEQTKETSTAATAA